MMEKFVAKFCPHCGNQLKLLPVGRSLYCILCEVIVKRIDALDEKPKKEETSKHD